MAGNERNERANLNELRLPPSVTATQRLSSVSMQPAAWANRIVARTHPLVEVGFGDHLMRRFDVSGASGVWANNLANRFITVESQPSAAELPLAPRAHIQRSTSIARWRNSWPTSPSAPS